MTTPLAGLLPNGMQQFIDVRGRPLVGGKVYYFAPGTTVPKTTWQDPQQLIPNTNPVILDSRGQCLVYGSGQYRQVVRDSAENTIWDRLTEWDPVAGASTNVSGLVFCADGGGSVLTTGVMRMGLCPFACTVTGWTVQADVSGSISLDVWANTFVNDVPPTVANTICGGSYPTLASNIQKQSTNVSSWHTALAANSAIIINIRSVATIKKCTLTLTVQ